MPLSKNTAAYRPEPGSLAYRVIDLISRNLQDDFTTSDLVRKLGITSNSLSALLATPVSHGLLRFDRNDPDDASKTWKAGENMAEWLTLVQANPGPVWARAAFEPSQKAAAASGSAAPAPAPDRAYHRLDPLTVPIRSGLPIPSIDVGRALGAPYAVLWSRMQAGDSVELIDKQASSLLSYLRKSKHAHTVRRTGTGVKSIWRTA